MSKSMNIKVDENTSIPIIIQDGKTNEISYYGFIKGSVLNQIIQTKNVILPGISESEKDNFGIVNSICVNSDKTSFLIKTDGYGKIATDNKPYFSIDVYKKDKKTDKTICTSNSIILERLYDKILERSKDHNENSYTCYLFQKGIDKILKKVGEECSEVIIASKNDSRYDFIYEVCDLLYHILVLLVEKEVRLNEVYQELDIRSTKENNKKPNLK